MNRTLQLITAALAAGFVAVVCVVGYAWLSGAVTVEEFMVALGVLRGEAAAAPQVEKKETPKDLTSRYADEALKEKQRAIEDLKAQEELLAVRLNERRAELARIEGEAARVRKEVADRVETVARAEKAFADARTAREKLVKSAGFRKQVETFAAMKERDVARYLYGYENGLALEVLRAFDADFRAKVIEEIDRLDRARGNAAREPKAPALLRMLWPGDAGTVSLGER